MKTSPDSTALVILNYNGLEHLQRNLPSCYALLEHSPEACLYVADNCSTDGSEEFLLSEGFVVQVKGQEPAPAQRRRLVKLPENYGFAQGYNLALKQIQAEYYWLLNSDLAVAKESLEHLLIQMRQHPDIWVCQPKILSMDEPNSFEYAGAAGGWIDSLGYPFCRGRLFDTCELDTGQYDDEAEIFWASGAALFIRAERFHNLQGFDANFFAHMEEIDLCWRIKRLGGRVAVYPQAVVWHLGGGTLGAEKPQKTYLNFRNSLYCLYLNDEQSGRALRIFTRLVLDGFAALRFLFKFQFRHIWAIAKAHWVFFAQIGRLRRQRKSFEEQRQRFRPQSRFHAKGLYQGSIVWAYFIKGKKHFSQLLKN